MMVKYSNQNLLKYADGISTQYSHPYLYILHATEEMHLKLSKSTT